MPLLLQIFLRRLLLGVFSFLAFLGINPDIAIPALDEVEQTRQEQRELVEEVLTQPDKREQTEAGRAPLTEVEKKITDIQKEVSQAVTGSVQGKIVQTVVPQEAIAKTDGSATPFNVRDVVVNVMCLEKTAAYTRMSSGSGVLISSSGLVLTNAHVAYPFLLGPQFDRNTYSCSIRRENIPNYGFNAELVYYPLDWLTSNSEIIKEPSPVGTGENDYAILAIIGPIGPAPKIGTFASASLNVSTADLQEDTPVTVAGFPSSNSGVFDVDSHPGLKVAQTQIDDFFTFSSRSYDILQTGVNSVAKRGSSGGGVFSGNTLYGLVVTTNQIGDGSYLNALTIPYIKRDFADDTGMNLDTFVTTSFDILRLRFSISYKEELNRIISESLGE